MTLGWVVTGTIAQFVLAGFLGMYAIFSGGGYANGGGLNKIASFILDMSMFTLPASCLVSAGIVIYQYSTDGNIYSYLWYALPILLAIMYNIYTKRM